MSSYPESYRAVVLAYPHAVGKELTTHCIICGRRSTVLGCFVPDVPELWTPLAPPLPGLTRTLWYGLCRKCARRDGIQYRVEAKLREERAAQCN